MLGYTEADIAFERTYAKYKAELILRDGADTEDAWPDFNNEDERTKWAENFVQWYVDNWIDWIAHYAKSEEQELANHLRIFRDYTRVNARYEQIGLTDPNLHADPEETQE